MMSATTTKTKRPQTRRRGEEAASERIEMRVAPRDKRKVVLAAKKYRESASAFLMSAALHEIERRERESESIKLSQRDQRTFVQALLDPAHINKSLLAAARAYREDFALEPAGP